MANQYTEICYVVRDLESTIARWVEVTGAGPFFTVHSDVTQHRLYRGEPAKDKFLAALGFLNATLMEFVQPLNDEPSIYQEVLQHHGEVVHHVYPNIRPLQPEEYDAQYARYVQAGYEPLLTFTIPGIGRNDFFDARKDFGCFFELLEVQPDSHTMIEKMHAIHLEWDRKNPIRDFFSLA